MQEQQAQNRPAFQLSNSVYVDFKAAAGRVRILRNGRSAGVIDSPDNGQAWRIRDVRLEMWSHLNGRSYEHLGEAMQALINSDPEAVKFDCTKPAAVLLGKLRQFSTLREAA